MWRNGIFQRKRCAFVHGLTSTFTLGTMQIPVLRGAHAALKKYLRGSIDNLYFVFEAMERYIIDQHTVASKALSDQRQLIPNRLHTPFFAGVVKKISSWALQKVYEEYITLQRSYMFKLELRPCTKYYQQALGIPCAHILSNRLPADDPET